MARRAACCLFVLLALAVVQGQTSKTSKKHKDISDYITAHTDTIAHLPEALKRKLSKADSRSINQTIHDLNNVKLDIVVDVRLVGFDGTGAGKVHLSDHQLYSYLQQHPSRLPTVALQPEIRELPFQPRIIFSVSHASSVMAHRLSDAIAGAVREGSSSGDDKSHTFVKHQVTDDVVHDDYVSSPAHGQYAIYVLNPRGPGQSYNYIYTEDYSGCPGQLYTSSAKPYMWVDITADTAFYGPGPGGRGQVFEHSLPRLSHYKPEFMPAALYPDLTAMLWSACQHLIWPPLQFSQLPTHESLQVELVYMHNTLAHPPQVGIPSGFLSAMLHHASGGVQNSSVSEAWLAFSKCETCSAAYSNALKVRTARVPAPSFRVASSHFLDSSVLHAWLQEYQDAILADAGVRLDQDNTRRLLPVFVFDMALQEPLLLDGWRQSVAFEDMVIVVRSSVATYTTYFQCNHGHVDIDLRELTRPILAGVAQSAWGVADTALHYSHGAGRDWNYLWSAGSTPFSPISAMATYSFVQVDAARRNLVLSSLNHSVAYVSMLLQDLDKLSGDGTAKSALPPEAARTFRQRINMISFKLAEAMVHLSLRRFNAAMIVARSLEFDTAAVHKLMRWVAKESPVTLQCHTSNHELYYLLPVGGVLVALAGAVIRHVVISASERNSKMF